MIKKIFYISKILFLKLILCTTLLASDVIIPQQKPKDENIDKINYNSHKKKWDLKSYKTYVFLFLCLRAQGLQVIQKTNGKGGGALTGDQ